MTDQFKPQVTERGAPGRKTQGPGNKTQLRGIVDAVIDAATNPVCNTAGVIPGVGPLLGTACRVADITQSVQTNRSKPGQTTLDQASTAVRDQAANLAPNQSQPSQSFQPGLPLFRPGVGAGVIAGNALNGYIDVQYHLTLSAISELSVKRIQPELVNQGLACGKFVEEMQQSTRKDGSVTLASTGEVFRNEFAEVNEDLVKYIEPTEAKRTGLSLGIGNTVKEINELKKEQAALEQAGRGIRRSAEINGLIAQKTRNLERMANGLKAERTTEQVTNEQDLSERRYYNIKSLTFTNVMAPNPANPMFANFIGAEMTLVEPYGFRLHEDIKEIANKLGYAGVHSHRMVWRLDIHFSGYDPDTGVHVPFIPISPKSTFQAGCDGARVSFYMVITGMDAKMTHEGTEYKIKLAPSGAMALRPEDAIMEASGVERGRTFGEFLTNFSAFLAQQKRSQAKESGHDRDEDFTVERIYEFIAPQDLLQAPFDSKPGESVEHDTSENPADGGPYQFQKGTSVLTAIQRVLADIEKVQNDFLAASKENEEFTNPRIRYAVRVNTLYDEKNERINDYKKIRFQYIIEPHLSYKDFTPVSNEQILKAVSLQARLKRLKEMIAYGMVLRKYDYLFTQQNTEVINLDMSFSVFYFKTLAQDDTISKAYALGASIQAASDEVDRDKSIQNETQGEPQSDVLGRIDDEAFRTRLETDINGTLKRLFGFAPSNTIKASAENINLMSMALTTAQKTIFTQSANRTDSMQDSKFNRKNLYLREVDDNLNNDLLTIEMDVRGDPVYLFSPYASEGLSILEPFDAIRFSNVSPEAGGNPDANKLKVQPSADKVIFLNVLTPEQTDFMNPEQEFKTSKSSIVGGFYIITKVESTMDGGIFQQKITATKIANMNYLSENIELFERQRTTGAPNPDDRGERDE